MTIGTCAPERLSLKAIIVQRSVFRRFNHRIKCKSGAVFIGFGLKPAMEKAG